MRKQLSFLFLLMVCFSFALQAKNTVVKTKTDFTTAWGALADGDTISVAYNGGVALNTGTVTMSAAGGTITLRAADPDSIPLLQIGIEGATLADGKTCGLIFENLHLQYRSPDGTSGQIIYFNKKYANISKLIFRNCEISRSVRSLFRSVKPDNAGDVTYSSCGDVDYFEMTNCLVHNTFYSGHNWPLVYFGHLPVEVNFKNNTFYDMPYLKSVFTMNYAATDQGRNAVINFENNTVCLSGPTNGLISTGSYLGQEAQFNFNNNLLIVPNWVNASNLHDTLYANPKVVVAKFGMISAQNNLIQGYNNWTSGQSIDATTGEGAFVSLDTVPQYTMTDLGVSMSDFTNPEGGNYSYLFNSKLATSGKDGKPIGDPRWVLTYKNPVNFTASADIAEAVVTPLKGVFEKGDSVTVSSTVVVGYTFKNWQDALGNVVSTQNPYKFQINSNTNLIAHYEALMSRTVTVSLKGTSTASYSIAPVQPTYYVGDVITTTLNDHAVNTFKGWSDGIMTMVRKDTIKDNLTLTANFEQAPYLLAWDFCNITANNQKFSNLVANHYADTLNTGMMNYVGLDTISKDFQTRNNKFTLTGLNNCALRKTPSANFANPDYLFIKFSTKGRTGLKVTSSIGSDNCAYRIQKMQYSLNGKDYIDFAKDSLPAEGETGFGSWFKLNGSLPAAANNQDTVYVRWVADPTSNLLAVSTSDKSFEYLYISKIVVLMAEDLGGASWRVDPVKSYTPGQVIESVPGIKLTLGGTGNVWTTAAATRVINGVTYLGNLNGNGNPKDPNNGNFSSSGLPPVTGTFYKFEVAAEGTLEAAVIVNAGKKSYITEDAVALTNYNGFTVAVKADTAYKIPVAAGKTYHFFSEGSKMGISGFVYTPKDPLALKPVKTLNGIYTSGNVLFVNAVKAEVMEVFDIAGKRVFATRLSEGLNMFNSLNKGLYIVKIGNEKTKVIL